MKTTKKVLYEFKPTRSIYDQFNKVYNGKVKETDKRDEIRNERRLKKINRYDPDVTGETPIENFNPNKAKIISILIAWQENQCLRKKEQNSLKNLKNSIHKWAQTQYEDFRRDDLEIEMLKAACSLPPNLMCEVLDLGDELYEERVYYDQAPNIEFIEYEDSFLYAHQLLRIYPDDYHQILKTTINSTVYFNEITSAGKEAGEMDEEIDTLNMDTGMEDMPKL